MPPEQVPSPVRPAPAHPVRRFRTAGLRSPAPGVPYAPVTGALRAVETFLLSGGQQTARRNAWAAVVADRQRARDRREAEHEIAALAGAERGSASQPR